VTNDEAERLVVTGRYLLDGAKPTDYQILLGTGVLCRDVKVKGTEVSCQPDSRLGQAEEGAPTFEDQAVPGVTVSVLSLNIV